MLCFNLEKLKFHLTPKSLEYQNKGGKKSVCPFLLPPFLYFLRLLSHFSCVWFCATPPTAAHQTPLSLGFSRQEHRSGLPLPFPVYESEKWKSSRSAMSDSLWFPWTAAHQTPLSMDCCRQEHWSGWPFPSPGDLPHPRTEPKSPVLAGRFLTPEPPTKP